MATLNWENLLLKSLYVVLALVVLVLLNFFHEQGKINKTAHRHAYTSCEFVDGRDYDGCLRQSIRHYRDHRVQ